MQIFESMEFSIFHWLLNPLIFVAVFKISFKRFSYLSFQAAFLISFIIQIYIQALNVYIIEDVNSPVFAYSVWAIPYIFLFTSKTLISAFKIKVGSIRRNVTSFKISKRDLRLRKTLPLLSTFFIGLPVVYIIDKGTSSITLFFLLSADSNAAGASVLRHSGYQSNISPLLTTLYSYSLTLLYPLYLSFLAALFNNKLVNPIHFATALFSSCLFSLFTGAKAPLAYYIITMALAYYFSSNSSRLRFEVKYLIYPLIAIFLPSLLYPLTYGSGNGGALAFALANLWRRVTYVPSLVSGQYFDVFPYVLDYQGFSSNRWFSSVAGVEWSSTPREVFQVLFPGHTGPGGLVNASFFSSFYADWGVAGVICGTMLVATVLSGLQVFFDFAGSDNTAVAFRTVSLVAVLQLMNTDFYSASLGRGMISSPIMLFMLSLSLRLRLKKKIYKAQTK